MTIFIDFETRSKVNIKNCGASVYARDESTEILCLAYSLDNGQTVKLWVPGEDPPEDLLAAIARGELIHAFNVMFERLIWHHICHKRLGWIDVQFSQWRCTMAAAARLALPRSLKGVGDALDTETKKDDRGHRVMMKLARPRKPTKNNPNIWHEKPEDFQTLYEYCMTDVLAEASIDHEIEAMPDSQIRVWQLDQRINLRGMPVDRAGIAQAKKVVAEKKALYGARLAELTDGVVTKPSDDKAIRAWLNSVGVETDTIAKQWIEDQLTRRRELLNDTVIEVLEIRLKGGKSSTSKLDRMEWFRDSDDRVRGGFRYHGALTGRWAGMGFQPHNYPSRGAMNASLQDQFFKDLELLAEDYITIDDFELLYGDLVDAVSAALRGMFLAPEGKKFYVCDFSGIEARVLAWLAGEEELLRMFPLPGDAGDSYKRMACNIYNITVPEVTKTQRQLGKIAVLGCGYGMGGPKFAASVLNFSGKSILDFFPKEDHEPLTLELLEQWENLQDKLNDDLPEDEGPRRSAFKKRLQKYWDKGELLWTKNAHKDRWKEPDRFYVRLWQAEQVGRSVVNQYREANPNIRQFWQDIDKACKRSIANPGRRFFCGKLSFITNEDRSWMKIKLPSGRELSYRNPRLIKTDAPWDLEKPKKERKQVMQVQYEGNGPNGKWVKIRTYGGKLVENVTQAASACLLMEAMMRVEMKGYSVIASIHDEIVSETDEDFGTMEEFEQLMKLVPTWAKGCPIGVEGFEGKRYRK